MPVFLFISGFFWKDGNINDPKGFVKRRIKGLYLPYLVYELVFFFLRPFFLSIGWYDPATISWNFGVVSKTRKATDRYLTAEKPEI